MDFCILFILCLLKFTVVTINTTSNDTEHNQYLLCFFSVMFWTALVCVCVCARARHKCMHVYHSFKITLVKNMLNICSETICACGVSHKFLASNWMVKQVFHLSDYECDAGYTTFKCISHHINFKNTVCC